MRLSIFFKRPSVEPKPKAKSEMLELPRNWTSRDWADLPPFHPRRD